MNLPTLLCCIHLGRADDGSLYSVLEFTDDRADPLVARAGDPDLGLDEAHTVLHDALHLVVALLAGVGASPVLERVCGLRPGASQDPAHGLTAEQVALEEAAVFAIHAWVTELQRLRREHDNG